MENKKNVVKSMKLNVDFINFINKVKIETLENLNKEKLELIYESEIGKVFNNVKRVYNRVMRDELKNILEIELKNRNMSMKEFKEISNKIVGKSEMRNSNYIKVEY